MDARVEPANITQVRRLLVYKLRPDKIGDTLMMAAAIDALTQAYPHLEVYGWSQDNVKALWDLMPGVTGTVSTFFRPSLARQFRERRELRAMKFDAAIFPTYRVSPYLMTATAARIPIRIAATKKWYRRLLTHNVEADWGPSGLHEVELCTRVFERGFGITLPRQPFRLLTRPEHEAAAASLLPDDVARPVILNFATGGSSHGLGDDRYHALIGPLVERGFTPVVLGAPATESRAKAIAAAHPKARTITTAKDLGTLVATLARADAMITGSTGPMHLAAATQLPLVMVETMRDWPSRVPHWTPWMCPYELVTITTPPNEVDIEPRPEDLATLTSERILAAFDRLTPRSATTPPAPTRNSSAA